MQISLQNWSRETWAVVSNSLPCQRLLLCMKQYTLCQFTAASKADTICDNQSKWNKADLAKLSPMPFSQHCLVGLPRDDTLHGILWKESGLSIANTCWIHCKENISVCPMSVPLESNINPASHTLCNSTVVNENATWVNIAQCISI